MERSRFRVPRASVPLPLQGFSTTASIRSGVPSRTARRARDGSFVLPLQKGRNYLPARSGLVLFVADLFHPVGGLAIETFLNGDVRHGCGRRGAVPMFLTRLEPDHVTRPNVLDRTSPALYPAAASRHDQGLAQRVAVPCCPSAGLERDTGADRACRIGRLEQGVNAYSAGKVLCRSFAGRL